MQDCFCVLLVCGATLVDWLRLFKPNELIQRLCDYVGLALGHVFGISHIGARLPTLAQSQSKGPSSRRLFVELSARGTNRRKWMTDAWGTLRIEVLDDDIIVCFPGTIYTVTSSGS
jgi:hypothetical protein